MSDILKYSKQLEFDKLCAIVADYAVSLPGKKAVLETEPITDMEDARRSADFTDALFKLLVRNRQPQIYSVDGISEISVRAKKGGVLSMGELLTVSRMLKNARNLRAWQTQSQDFEFDEVNERFYPLFEDMELERRIDGAILSDTEMADTASGALLSIRKKIRNAELSIRGKLDSIVKGESSKYLQDAIITMRGGRYVVPVKNEYKNEIKGLVHDVSSSGGTSFIEPAAVVEANNLIVSLLGDEAVEIERILYGFSADVGHIADSLRESFTAFVGIDAAMAKARYGMSTNAVKPLFSDNSFDFKKARHPLISKDRVVPIDISLGKGYGSLIITGPNTGGKTVSLKTVGLLTLMAMSGMLIPAAEKSVVRLYKRILVDIGDEQSIAQNLSTFSGHIKNTISILDCADSDSLVLLDELGAGTDPAEGAALAIAVLDSLKRRGSSVVATTHYGEIKMYAMETEGVQNASCEFDIATLSPTYRINMGIPGMSNALLISERLGMNKVIVEAAKRNLSSEAREFEDILTKIENMKHEVAESLDAADEKLRLAEQKLADAEKERLNIEKRARAELESAKERAKQIVADVSAKAYALQDEIRRLDKEKEKNRDEALQRARAIAKNETQKLFDMSDPVAQAQMDALLPVTEPKLHQKVVHKELNQLAEIISLPKSGDTVEVKVGALKMRVPLSKLGLPPTNIMNEKKKHEYNPGTVVSSARSEINLLGKNVDEAVVEIDAFIEQALRAKLSTIYVIHGKGTGALRAGVHMYLRRQKNVASFRLGRYGEGEEGVTVVELK